QAMGKAVVRALEDMIIKMVIIQPLAKGLSSFLNPFAAVTMADGGVVENGVKKFAGGGIVNSPTVFPMANGMGLMGEAGPEAIMPLQRGPGGRLGVSAHGGSGGTQRVEIHLM